MQDSFDTLKYAQEGMVMEFGEVYEYTKNLNILYVEDELNLLEDTKVILEKFFHIVVTAVDGIDGLNKYKVYKEKYNKDFDLIITDINMPNMDGLTMIEKIRKENQGISIVVLSAHEDTEYLLKSIDLQVDGFLSKPIIFEKYIKTIYKIAKNIDIKKELDNYKIDLERKVRSQVLDLIKKDNIIQQNAKMAAVGEMIDIIAHQWKQPLNIILLKTDFLSEFVKDGETISSEDIIKCSNTVKSQVKHLVDTLDEFRGFFRPTTSIEVIDLNELFDSLNILLKDDLKKYQIELKLLFTNIKFNANQNEFKHIFINFINNAKDAFEQNKIDNREIIVDAVERKDDLLIKIKDNAGGIPEDIVKNIFEPNFTTKGDIGGTGIGLYMCKTIAAKYNITIDVEVFDGGTQFILGIKKLLEVKDDKYINYR